MKTKQKQFKIIIERDEGGIFVASVPALPGCNTQGKTMVELERNARDAIKLCLSVAKTNPAYRKRIRQYAHEPSFIGVDTVRI